MKESEKEEIRAKYRSIKQFFGSGDEMTRLVKYVPLIISVSQEMCWGWMSLG